MKSKAIALTFCLLSLSLAARAQESGPRQLIVPLAGGAYVAFRAETALPETGDTKTDFQQIRGVFDSQALVDDNQIIHRMLVDTAGKPVFGYDLLVVPNPTLRQFNVSARPLDAQFASKLIARSAAEQRTPQSGTRISTLPEASLSQLLDDGDVFTLDLLVNSDSGIKIVDVVKVSFDRARLWDLNPKTLPRDFTLDAVQLAVTEYRLLINGTLVAKGHSTAGCSGALLWFYISDRGRFIFSLVPRAGYQFQKVGFVADNKIEFTVGGDHYEWISNAPVLKDGGAWNLWVLHDPKYMPWFYESQRDPKKTDKWDRLNLAVKNVKDRASKILDQKQTTFQTGSGPQDVKLPSRPRVIIGGGDRIENLWPKN
jgi:hypothetical protein